MSTVWSGAVASYRTVYLPFGFEAIATQKERHEVIGLLDYLLEQQILVDGLSASDM